MYSRDNKCVYLHYLLFKWPTNTCAFPILRKRYTSLVWNLWSGVYLRDTMLQFLLMDRQ